MREGNQKECTNTNSDMKGEEPETMMMHTYRSLIWFLRVIPSNLMLGLGLSSTPWQCVALLRVCRTSIEGQSHCKYSNEMTVRMRCNVKLEDCGRQKKLDVM